VRQGSVRSGKVWILMEARARVRLEKIKFKNFGVVRLGRAW